MKNLVLEVKGVSKSFGGITALKDISLSVYEGESLGIIGPNGAGKTTLFNVISGFIAPDSGGVVFRGENITFFPSYRIAEKGISRTFQNLQVFFDLTVLENIMVGMDKVKRAGFFQNLFALPAAWKTERITVDEAYAIAKEVGLGDLANVRAGDLPFGKARLVELARGIASSPDLLLLDEIASGLNSRETMELTEVLENLKKKYNLTLMVVEHDMDFIMGLCERIMVLNFGTLIAEGSPDDVRKNPEVISAYLGE